MIIDTTDLYEQLQEGAINIIDKAVQISAGAEADLSTELKLFWNLPCRSLRFSDARGNRVDMDPSEATAVAYFRSGHNLTLGLPDTYKKYTLFIQNSVNFTAAEVEYIFRWKNAAELTLVEDNNLPYRLTLRRNRLRHLTQLWSLRFSVNPGTFAKLAVWKLLKGFPALEAVDVNVDALDAKQIDRFAGNQGKFKEWTVSVNGTNVEFRRIAPEDSSRRASALRIGGTSKSSKESNHVSHVQ